MRIGTWNLAGRWSDDHAAFLHGLDCDILLLTEVSERVQLDGQQGHVTQRLMAARRHWAGICRRHPLKRLPDPHGASAMAEALGLRLCSSVLPWRSCGPREPWVGANTYERTAEAVVSIESARPEVWGGDWNHAFRGREYGGSMAGRRSLMDVVGRLGLATATVDVPHQIDGLWSIDHIAVPDGWATRAEHHCALLTDGRLSDHDASVVEVDRR